MTATEFASRVTAIIDALTGGSFCYSEAFESECSRLMAAQMSAEDTAEQLMSPPCYAANIHHPACGETHRKKK